MALPRKDQLTDDQKEALLYMKDFIEGPNREMVLRGPAGTGKTSLVNVLLADKTGTVETNHYRKVKQRHIMYNVVVSAL